MSVEASPSDWDSDLFKVRVGKLKITSPVSVEAVVEANRNSFDVVFVKTPDWVDPVPGMVAVDHLYDMERGPYLESYKPPVTFVNPNPSHIQIARTAFRGSRFFRDPNLACYAPEVYARWISSRRVWTLDLTPDDAFLAVDEDDGAHRISLVAVNDRRRSAGIGTLLMNGVMNRVAPLWCVKVSSRNHRAIRCYESLGFRVKTVHTAFHVWTKSFGRP